MGESASESTRLSSLERANFSGELCSDAAKFLEQSMRHKTAYVINNMLVLKMSRYEEAYHLGLDPKDVGTVHSQNYGLRVALCIRDNPPFKKGEWYTVSDEESRRELIRLTAAGDLSIQMTIVLNKWKHIVDIAEENKSEELLEKAILYTEEVNAT